MKEAERIAIEEHRSLKLAVISGVGTRHYYRCVGLGKWGAPAISTGVWRWGRGGGYSPSLQLCGGGAGGFCALPPYALPPHSGLLPLRRLGYELEGAYMVKHLGQPPSRRRRRTAPAAAAFAGGV